MRITSHTPKPVNPKSVSLFGDAQIREVIGALILLQCVLALGCDERIHTTCGELPEANACPQSRGGTCDDTSCSALYRCDSNGKWTKVKTCDQNISDGGVKDSGSETSNNCTPRNDVGADEPGESCANLQAPDCDLFVAAICPESACTSGCDSFLRCENGSWSDSYIAYCNENGELIWNE